MRTIMINKIDRADVILVPMSYEELHAVTQYLYKLLDDIDTASDIAKGDDKLYRSIVHRTQSKKSEVVDVCDGYVVTFKPLSSNNVNT